VLALLGVLRAGLIPALIPLLWRREDMIPALSRVGAKTIIAGGRVAGTDLCDVALHVAAELFSIRYVCGFGDGLADGVIPLGELHTIDRLDPTGRNTADNPASHVAAITWDTTSKGYVPVARNHAELIAGGMAVIREGQIAQDATILSTLMFSSFSGLALGVIPWLLTGGTLVLHQPFDAVVLAAQCAEHGCDTVALPGPLLMPLLEVGLLSDDLRSVLAAWRAPERIAASPSWNHARTGLVDVQLFGEVGLIAARRDAGGLPVPLPLGVTRASRGTEDGAIAAETVRTSSSTLALRGPMVPRHPFPSDTEPGDGFVVDASGWADTGYPCRLEGGTLQITGPPASLVGVGGYRFVQRTLQEQIGEAGIAASITALPDELLSHRLAGSASDSEALREALRGRGVNPLLVAAFRDRRKTMAA